VHARVAVAAPVEACTSLLPTGKHKVASIRNRVVVVQRGGCPLLSKAQHAHDAGAIGLIIVDTPNGSCGRTPAGGDGKFEVGAGVFDEHCVAGSAKHFGEGFGLHDPPLRWQELSLPTLLVSSSDGAKLLESIRNEQLKHST
jgi:hypothetical protein